jgi:hypothetical protein
MKGGFINWNQVVVNRGYRWQSSCLPLLLPFGLTSENWVYWPPFCLGPAFPIQIQIFNGVSVSWSWIIIMSDGRIPDAFPELVENQNPFVTLKSSSSNLYRHVRRSMIHHKVTNHNSTSTIFSGDLFSWTNRVWLLKSYDISSK